MLTNIRKPQPSDLNYLVDIDLKCFEDNLSLDDWRDYLLGQNYNILIGTLKTTPVGLIVWQSNKISKIAVKPAYRHRGVGTKLLVAVENTLMQQGFDFITLDVPESLCCPGKPIDSSNWLGNRRFKASKLISKAGVFCGVVEDIICFEKRLSETVTYG